MTFRIGQRVVCIKEGRWFSNRPGRVTEWPSKGSVYIIAGFDDAPEGLYLELEGIVCLDGGLVPSWDATNFRPLTKRDTSAGVEALRKLQDPNNHTIPLPEDREALENALLEIFDEALR